jgi:hypothetical protein
MPSIPTILSLAVKAVTNPRIIQHSAVVHSISQKG